jgi:single-strand DNA-binding protein
MRYNNKQEDRMNDLNSVYLVGRLTDDVKSQKLGNGKVRLSFSLANNQYHYNEKKREYDKCTGFFRIVSFVEEGSPLKGYLRKGIRVGVNGKLQANEHVSGEGKKSRQTSIMAFSVQLLEPHTDHLVRKTA